jgi:hypothetical protein
LQWVQRQVEAVLRGEGGGGDVRLLLQWLVACKLGRIAQTASALHGAGHKAVVLYTCISILCHTVVQVRMCAMVSGAQGREGRCLVGTIMEEYTQATLSSTPEFAIVAQLPGQLLAWLPALCCGGISLSQDCTSSS